MKRSVQEIVELLVFGLIALLIGTGLLWLAGWIFDLVGVLFKFFAALIWSLLRFIVPVAVGAAIVYALVRLIQQQREKSAEKKSATSTGSSTETASAADTISSGPGNGPVVDTTPVTPPPPAVPDEQRVTEDPFREGESHPTASEVWVPPQPSPPTSSSETLDEPRPVQDSGPVEEPPAFRQPAPASDPLDHASRDEASGSVPPIDDNSGSEVPEESPSWEDGVAGTDEDRTDDDAHRS